MNSDRNKNSAGDAYTRDSSKLGFSLVNIIHGDISLPASRQQKFQQLTRPWRDRLYSVALRQTSTVQIAEDWVQETLLRAWRDIDALKQDQAIYAWLLKILGHVIADDTRRETRRQQLSPVVATDDEILQEFPSSKPGPFEHMVQHQTDAQVQDAIKHLPDDFAIVIMLRDIEGLSYREISDLLDIPQGTLMSRLSRGRRLLARYLITQNEGRNPYSVQEKQP